MSSSSSSSEGGCSCAGLVIGLLVLWALFFGLPWPGGAKYNIDIFPPRVWDMNEKVKPAPVAPVVKPAPVAPEDPDLDVAPGYR